MDLFSKSKSINLVFLGYFALLPFVFSGSIADPFLLPRQLLTTVLLFIILAVLFKNKAVGHFTLDSSALCFLGFIVFCCVSFSKSQIADLSHATLSKYIVYFLFFILVRQLIISNLLDVGRLKSHVILFGVLATAIALLSLLSKTIGGYNFFRLITIVTGTFGNKNFLASILFSCFPFYFIGILMSKKIRIISAAAIVLSMMLLLMLRTRTVLIALGLFLFLVLLFEIKTRFSKKIYYAFNIALLATAIIGASYLFSIKDNFSSPSGIGEHYFQRLLSSGTFYERVEFWNQAIYIIRDNFFNGIGVGNWIATYPKYGLHHFSDPAILNGRMIVNTPHNDFLMILSEIGIFGFLCYVGIFITILYQAYWLSKNEAESRDRKSASYFLLFIICYAVIAFFDFPLTRIEHQIILLTVFAIINTKYFKARKPNGLKIPASLAYPLSFMLLLYATTILAYRINGEKHLSKALAAEKILDAATAAFEFQKAKNPFFSTDTYAIPLDWHLGRIQFNQGYFDESLEYFNDAYIVNPFSLVVHNDLGSALIKNNRTEEALKHYLEALKISPSYEDSRINLAATYYNLKKFDRAFTTIEKCDVNSKNPVYKQMLTPIVEKKLNETLNRINNPKVNNYLKSKIKTEDDLLNLFFDYKKNNGTFDKYLQNLIR